MNPDLEAENQRLLTEIEKLKKQLENGTMYRKKYYEKNKEIVNEKAKQRMKRLAVENPEKIKEYKRTYYLKKKEEQKKRLESSEGTEGLGTSM